MEYIDEPVSCDKLTEYLYGRFKNEITDDEKEIMGDKWYDNKNSDDNDMRPPERRKIDAHERPCRREDSDSLK